MVRLPHLKEFEFFRELPNDEIERLSSCARLKHYPKDAVILKKGENTSALYLVANGLLKVRRLREDEREVILSILKTGDIFGEMAFLDNGPRSADVLAIAPSDLIVIQKKEFELCMEENRNFMLKIIRTLVKRLARADTIIERLSLDSVYERLIHFLEEHSEPDPKTGEPVIRMWMTQMELASIIGASREMVSKIMKELVDGEFIVKNGKDLIIKKKFPPSW